MYQILSIGSKQGEINGTVKGTKGIANVDTISAVVIIKIKLLM